MTSAGEECTCPPHMDGIGRDKWPDCPVHTLRDFYRPYEITLDEEERTGH